jgi:hypothetical protein
MIRGLQIVMLCVLFSVMTGCVSQSQPTGVTVTSLDRGEIPQMQAGEFDVYTGTFLIENPTNVTFENIGVDISLQPTMTYCHGVTKSFTYPELFSREKKTEQISIAEFGNLGCQYNYSYQVSYR